MSESSEEFETPTLWLAQLRSGHADAAQKLWQEYFERLVRLARERLTRRVRRAEDEEDVALSAFNSFCHGVEKGRFPQISDRDDLWRVLVTLTLRKVFRLVRGARTLKRGGGWQHLESTEWDGEEKAVIDRLLGREPTPEFVAELIGQWDDLVARLGDPLLTQIAVLRMEGYTNAEIAQQFGITERTIERKLRLIRDAWESE